MTKGWEGESRRHSEARIKGSRFQTVGRRMGKQDYFRVLINDGNLLISGLDENLNSYRIIEYKGKKFQLKLTDVQ